MFTFRHIQNVWTQERIKNYTMKFGTLILLYLNSPKFLWRKNLTRTYNTYVADFGMDPHPFLKLKWTLMPWIMIGSQSDFGAVTVQFKNKAELTA